jgi:hypothetical protein
MAKHKIVLKFENGAIREAHNIPEHYTLQLFDYHIHKYQPTELSEDEHHNRCKVVEWPSEARHAGGR